MTKPLPQSICTYVLSRNKNVWMSVIKPKSHTTSGAIIFHVHIPVRQFTSPKSHVMAHFRWCLYWRENKYHVIIRGPWEGRASPVSYHRCRSSSLRFLLCLANLLALSSDDQQPESYFLSQLYNCSQR